ncbi:MAG: TonB-dependent receptor [Candidatus Eisenbacteria bacterium]
MIGASARRSLVAILAVAGMAAGLAVPAFLAAPAWAGTTGKLAGRVTDSKGQPLVGVSVAVPALRTGAATDADGKYSILNLPPGTYDVRVNLLGYGPVTTTGVTVSSDLTVRLDLTLKEEALQMGEVVVRATRPVVEVTRTNSIATVSAQEIAKLPVQSLDDVVNLQAGVVDGHFRGGRIGEVQYQVDGISVNNVYDNKSSLRLDRSLLEEVQVISGTFDAEYGQAQSGVVNAVLKRGADKFEWNAEAYAGGFVYPGAAASRALPGFTLRPATTQNYQLSLSGPAPVAHTNYLVNVRRYVFDDFTDARRLFRPTDKSDVENNVFRPTGDGARVALGSSREWSGVAKVSNRSLPNLEIGYQAIVNVIDARPRDWAFRFLPEARTKQHTYSIVHGLDFNKTIDKNSFATLAVRQNYFDYHDWAYANLLDPRYLAAGPLVKDDGYSQDAWIQGVSLNRFLQNTNTLLFKGSFVRQASSVSQIKVGAEFQLPRVTFGAPDSITTTGDQLNFKFNPGYRTYFPVLASAFAQDQLEFNDLTLRAGVRIDMVNARSFLPSDLANPANAISGAPESHPQATTVKYALSPRLGVSWPTGPKSAAHFAYGHFAQFPSLGEIFSNADYSVLATLQATPQSESAVGVLGNPDIRPERTVQYEGGYKQAVSENLGADLTVFYKDIRDLLGVEFVETYTGAEYARLTNIDFGSVLGFTLAFDLRPAGPFGMTLDYTWQKATGNSSDPRETATRASNGEDPRPREIPFNWDQRHTLNLTSSYGKSGSYLLSTIVRVVSGQPYTPAVDAGFGNGLEANSGRKPASLLEDLRAEKDLSLGRMPAHAFVRVFNLFDQRFFNGGVFATSGSPYYSRFETDAPLLADPTRYYAPRRIEVGIRLAGGGAKGGGS